MSNRELMGGIEAKLFQIESMARIAMDNLNYENSGFDEPFINSVDMVNLMAAMINLANDIYDKVLLLDFNKSSHSD